MEDLQTVNEIINTAVKDSSYITVLISCGVFIAYTLINKLVDLYKAKDRNKPLLEMANAIKEVTSNVVKLNNVLDKTFQDANRKEIVKCKNTIELAFQTFYNNVFQTCRETIIHNNIDNNKDLIVANLTKVVNTEYYSVSSVLSLFEINGVVTSTYMKEKWIDDIIRNIVAIIYNGQNSQNRINSINTTLSISTNNYITYMNNKTFNG